MASPVFSIVKSFPSPPTSNNNNINYRGTVSISDNATPYTFKIPLQKDAVTILNIITIVTNLTTLKTYVRQHQFIAKYLTSIPEANYEYADLLDYEDASVNISGMKYGISGDNCLLVTVANTNNVVADTIKWIVDVTATICRV